MSEDSQTLSAGHIFYYMLDLPSLLSASSNLEGVLGRNNKGFQTAGLASGCLRGLLPVHLVRLRDVLFLEVIDLAIRKRAVMKKGVQECYRGVNLALPYLGAALDLRACDLN